MNKSLVSALNYHLTQFLISLQTCARSLCPHMYMFCPIDASKVKVVLAVKVTMKSKLTKAGQPVTAVTNHNRSISSRLTKSSLKKTFTQIYFREERLSQLLFNAYFKVVCVEALWHGYL